MSIESLTSDQRTARIASYMTRSLADLRSLAQTMGLDATGAKAQIVARIVDQAAVINTPAEPFNMTGLFIAGGAR